LRLEGRRFSRLTVVDRAPSANAYSRWHCVCDCGGRVTVTSAHLTQGFTKSCGCLRRETARNTGRLASYRRGTKASVKSGKVEQREAALAEVFRDPLSSLQRAAREAMR
jgi:hypothetical protein